MEKADIIEFWVKAVRAHAYNTLEQGGQIPGYKLVRKKSNRKWTDDDEANVVLNLQMLFGLSPEDVTRRKMLTPAMVEKMLSKDDRKDLAGLYTKPDAGSTMAKETDVRPAIAPSRSAVAEFSDIDWND